MFNMRFFLSCLALFLLAALAVPALMLPAAGPARALESDVFPELVYWSAIRSGDIEKMNRYLKLGFSPDNPDSSRNTPLMYGVKLGNAAMIDTLLEYRAKIDKKDDHGNTAMMWAASLGQAVILKRLIEAGADLDHQNKDGATALVRAVQEGKAESVRILLDAGADAGLADYTGRDAGYYAGTARSRSVKRLMREHADAGR